jgi:hypothetical protein
VFAASVAPQMAAGAPSARSALCGSMSGEMQSCSRCRVPTEPAGVMVVEFRLEVVQTEGAEPLCLAPEAGTGCHHSMGADSLMAQQLPTLEHAATTAIVSTNRWRTRMGLVDRGDVLR